VKSLNENPFVAVHLKTKINGQHSSCEKDLFSPLSQAIGHFILASNSPRRRELLHSVGLSFTVVAPEVSEIALAGESPLDCALRLAQLKARAIAETPYGFPIIAADTIVARNSEIFGKPRDIDDARLMLSALSGKEHQVVTGYCAVGPNNRREISGTVVTNILFRPLSDWDIDAYLALNESLDKAGAYSIQGSGGCLVDKITGSYTNIVGLPLQEVLGALREVC
jgi:septum formation protein